jgi:steroid delta-isomerase-like uncharacterized protein
MSIEQHKTVVRQYYQAHTSGDLTLVDQLLAPDYVHHDPVPGMRRDREGAKQTIAVLHQAFPDGQFTLEHLVAEGDIVVGHWTFRGTHQADYRGVPATHEPVHIRGVHLFRLVDGKIVEEWRTSDVLSLLQQLHAIPYWRQPKAAPPSPPRRWRDEEVRTGRRSP